MDSNKRSIVKGLTWRALAMLDTVLLALIFTGSIRAAVSIGGIELFTKIVWYYGHERLWVHIPGKHDRYRSVEKWLGHHTKMRGLIKAVSWRILGALDTFFIALFVTGKLAIGSSIGSTELVTKIALYYLHDRAWEHISWGMTGSKLKEESQHADSAPVKEFLDVFRNYYHLSVAVSYAVASVLFVLVSAAVIYGLHEAFLQLSPGILTNLFNPD